MGNFKPIYIKKDTWLCCLRQHGLKLAQHLKNISLTKSAVVEMMASYHSTYSDYLFDFLF